MLTACLDGFTAGRSIIHYLKKEGNENTSEMPLSTNPILKRNPQL